MTAKLNDAKQMTTNDSEA